MRTAIPLCLLLALLGLPALAEESAVESPVAVEGLWCGTGPLHEFSLQLAQQYQEVTGTLTRKQRVRTISGRIEGATIRTEAHRVGSLVLEAAGNELKVTGGEGMVTILRGQTFARATGPSCG